MKKVSTEQLIKILEENKDSVKKSPARNANDVHRFIMALDIKEGKHAVRNKMIYKAYKMWSSQPYTVRAFFCRFSKYFSPMWNGGKNWRYYNINYSGVELLNEVDNGQIKF